LVAERPDRGHLLGIESMAGALRRAGDRLGRQRLGGDTVASSAIATATSTASRSP